jgi:hypothetical protein
MYVPAGSVTPGSATGVLNVNNVRLSDVIALAPLAVQKTSTTNTEAEVINLFMLVLRLELFARWLPRTTQLYGRRTKRDA